MDGHPHIHENIAIFINSSRKSCRSANYIFVETINDKERFMSMFAQLYVCVAKNQYLLVKDELLVDHNYHRLEPTRKQRQVDGIPLEVPMGHKKKQIK
jgi:hypothetical protein